MTKHQKRILSRLLVSLQNFMRGGVSLQEVQLDLDANQGVVESNELRNAISAASNRVDECFHIYDDLEGKYMAHRIIGELIEKIVDHCEFRDQQSMRSTIGFADDDRH